MKKYLKHLLRIWIGLLTRQAIFKHRPVVVAVVGKGNTSIMREVIYSALREGIPTRRNLELPEVEFSIPITVLNYPNYPQSVVEWLWFILKTLVQTVGIRPYRHALVLEMHPLSSRVWEYWLGMVVPDQVVVVGEFDFSLGGEVMRVSETSNLTELKQVARQIAQRFGIDELDTDLGLELLFLPQGRVRFLRAKFPGTVIDGTYYYSPVKMQAIVEVANAFSGRKIVFSEFENDWEIVNSQSEHWLINPVDYSPQPEDVVVLRGRRPQQLPKFQHLAFTQDSI